MRLTWPCRPRSLAWGHNAGAPLTETRPPRALDPSAEGGCVVLAVSLGEVIVFVSLCSWFFCPVQSSVSIGFEKSKSMVLFSEF